MATFRVTDTHITLIMTHAEADALWAIAGEGYEGLYTDAAACAAYVGDAKARTAGTNAFKALSRAVAKTA